MAGKDYLDLALIAGSGDRADRDFALAVLMTLRWAQDRRSGPICDTLPISEELDDVIRSGLPPEGMAGWPPSDADLDLSRLPAEVPPTQVNARRSLTWRLTPERLDLTLETQMKGAEHRVVVEIAAGEDVRMRVRLWQATGHFVPGAPRCLRMVSSACDGLFDEGWQILPNPMPVDDEEAAATLAELVRSPERRLPVVVFCSPTANPAAVERVAGKFAFDAFPIAHVALVSGAGYRAVTEMLPDHPPVSSRLRTFKPGYTDMDVADSHPVRRIFKPDGADLSLDPYRAWLMRAVAERDLHKDTAVSPAGLVSL